MTLYSLRSLRVSVSAFTVGVNGSHSRFWGLGQTTSFNSFLTRACSSSTFFWFLFPFGGCCINMSTITIILYLYSSRTAYTGCDALLFGFRVTWQAVAFVVHIFWVPLMVWALPQAQARSGWPVSPRNAGTFVRTEILDYTEYQA